VLAIGAILSTLRDHREAQDLRAYETTQRAPRALGLPSAIRREFNGCGGAVCGYSTLTPPQLKPILARLLDAAPDAALARALPCLGPCPTLLRGHLHGYPVTADIFWHLIVVRHGRPPEGALPAPHGRGHLFYLGSDINISAVQPEIGG
jgi:hypothetical protein